MKQGTQYTPEMAVDLMIASDIQVSPGGDHLVFALAPIGHADTNPTSTIVFGVSDGSFPTEALMDRSSNNTSPRWSPDGRLIVFLSDRASRGTQQAYISQTYPGEPLQVTSIAGGVSSPAWIPDGSGLIVSANRWAIAGEADPKSEIQVASEQPRPRGLVLVPRLGGDWRQVGPTSGHVWSFAISPDGERLATFTSDTDLLSDAYDSVRLRIGSIDGESVIHEIGPFNGAAERIVWSSDGRHIAFIASKLPDARDSCIWVVNTGTGELTRFDDRGMTQSRVDFYETGLLVLSVNGQKTQLDTVDLSGAHWERYDLPEAIGDQWLRGVSVSKNGSVLACIAEPDIAPGDVWTVSRDGMVYRATHLNPILETVALSHLEPLQWKSTDGLTVEGWLLRPPNAQPDQRLPLVTYVHGGPSYQWGNWFHGTWHDWAHNLAARGFAVFLPNPRGSTGKGGAFTSANQADLGGLDFDDIMTGIDALVDRGIADNDRLGIGGWSYGGFIVAWAIGHTDRFKAAVAGAAVTNWVSKVGTTDIRRQNESNFAGQLHEAPDDLWERSPIRYLANMTTPTLIVHGAADPRVPVSQGMELYLGLKAVGVDTEFVSYPRQKHAFHERAFQLDLIQRLCDWYEHYL